MMKKNGKNIEKLEDFEKVGSFKAGNFQDSSEKKPHQPLGHNSPKVEEPPKSSNNYLSICMFETRTS